MAFIPQVTGPTPLPQWGAQPMSVVVGPHVLGRVPLTPLSASTVCLGQSLPPDSWLLPAGATVPPPGLN